VTATANDIDGTYRVTVTAAGARAEVYRAGTTWFVPWFDLTNLPKNTPTFAFDLSSLPTMTYGDSSFNVAGHATKPADDSGAITFQTATGSEGCTVTSDGEVTIIGRPPAPTCARSRRRWPRTTTTWPLGRSASPSTSPPHP
jgi:hypothetical protein